MILCPANQWPIDVFIASIKYVGELERDRLTIHGPVKSLSDDQLQNWFFDVCLAEAIPAGTA